MTLDHAEECWPPWTPLPLLPLLPHLPVSPQPPERSIDHEIVNATLPPIIFDDVYLNCAASILDDGHRSLNIEERMSPFGPSRVVDGHGKLRQPIHHSRRQLFERGNEKFLGPVLDRHERPVGPLENSRRYVTADYRRKPNPSFDNETLDAVGKSGIDQRFRQANDRYDRDLTALNRLRRSVRCGDRRRHGRRRVTGSEYRTGSGQGLPQPSSHLVES